VREGWRIYSAMESRHSVKDIEILIEKGAFWRAERRIRKLLKKDPSVSRAHYLLGIIYQDWRNAKRSAEKARECFEVAVKGVDPVDDAFVRLASLENGRPQKLRVLRRGIQKCPQSPSLYTELLDWTNPEDSETLFKEMMEKRTMTVKAVRIMAANYFTLERFAESHRLFSSLTGCSRESAMIDDLLAGYCLLALNDARKALTVFEALASKGVTYRVGYAPLFGLVTCYVAVGKNQEALTTFEEIPDDADLSPPYDEECTCIYDAYVHHVPLAMTRLLRITRSKRIVAKARGIRGLVVSSCAGDCSSRVIADLKAGHEMFPTNRQYCDELRKAAVQQGRWRDAYVYTSRYLWDIASRVKSSEPEDVDVSFVRNADGKDFEYMLDDMKDRLQGGRQYGLPYPAAPVIFDQIIDRLCDEKKYDLVCTLADDISEEFTKYVHATFRIAYSYSSCGKLREAEHYYRICEKRAPDDAAVANNIGYVYELKGEYSTAQKYYARASELNPSDELHRRNLSRLQELEKAASVFCEEPWDIKKSILIIWRQRERGCSVREASAILTEGISLSAKRADKTVAQLVEAKFLIAVQREQHERDDVSYWVNPYVVPLLSKFGIEFEHSEAIVGVASAITPESLTAIGYTLDVLDALKKVSSIELQAILRRDIREAALSLLTRCFKTTLVLSGSVIEAILLDRILAKGLTKYAMKNAHNESIQRMALDDLLYVAKNEGIIDDQTYHLAHALRGFRNLIHPGVEDRKAAMVVSEQNAKIAWDILRKLIVESQLPSDRPPRVGPYDRP
jgi:tetratricopeptide (TPR) repeat protein